MRAFIFLAALLCSLSSFAAARCDARVPTETVELGDVRLAYQSIGRDSDPALLLVMGLGGQLIHWPDEVVSALCEQGFRVIRYDNRDVGLSAWNVPVPSSRLLDALCIPQAHVLGASMGGMIAQHIADMAPPRLLSLTLVMTSSGAEGLPAPSESLLRLLARREAASREQAVEQQADLLAALGSPEVRDDRQQLLLQAARSYDRAFNPEGVQRQLLAILAEPSRVPLLNRLQVPTLVIHGTADPLLPVMHGVHVAAHIRGSELKLIPGLAHRFQEAFKEPLLAAVVPYLKAHRQASVVQL